MGPRAPPWFSWYGHLPLEAARRGPVFSKALSTPRESAGHVGPAGSFMQDAAAATVPLKEHPEGWLRTGQRSEGDFHGSRPSGGRLHCSGAALYRSTQAECGAQEELPRLSAQGNAGPASCMQNEQGHEHVMHVVVAHEMYLP